MAALAAEQEKKASEAAKVEAAKPAEPKVVAQPITGNVVEAPLPGRVIEILVKVGDEVKVGQAVVVLEAMKMENSITSDYSGTVAQILVAEGENIWQSEILNFHILSFKKYNRCKINSIIIGKGSNFS